MSNKSALLILGLALIVGLSSCGIFRKNNPSPTYLYSELNNLWVEKKAYYPNDTIRLNFSTKHPDELGLMDPDGNFYYLVYGPQVKTITNGQPIMTVAQFRPITFLEIIPSNTKANPHNVEFSGNINPFTKSGEYIFLLSQNLSTDAIGPAESVTIQYIHQQARP